MRVRYLSSASSPNRAPTDEVHVCPVTGAHVVTKIVPDLLPHPEDAARTAELISV
jgi:hypothetical protein